ncbi:MAG TPA: DUF3037 domain-containing protein [Puia sp.]|nr:DUF3037 domain-containing protein [Puia sp.]
MQDKHLFEYAVIRVVPRVEREEFLNVGVIVYCSRLKYLELIYTLDTDRLLAFYPKLDIAELAQHLQAFEAITKGSKDGGPIAQLDLANRFRWLTATRSTILQSSKVHPGFCGDPAAALRRMHATLVL